MPPKTIKWTIKKEEEPKKEKKEKQQLITETFRKSRSHSVKTSGPRSRSSREIAARSVSVGPKRYEQKEAKPRPKKIKVKETKIKPETEEKQMLQDIEKEPTVTTVHSTPRLNKNVESLLSKLQHAINKFGEQKRFNPEQTKDAQALAYQNTINSRKMHNTNQKQILERMIKNADANMDKASTYEKLLFNIGSFKSKSKAESSFPIFPLGSEGDETFGEEEADILPESQRREPVLSEAQLKHIKDVVDIMEKEPKLKNDINRTITEELTKGYINPEQFKHYKQEIEKVNIMKAPTAKRGSRIAKPRAKKTKQMDIPAIPMDIDTPSNIPTGKTKTQKKKDKIVVL